jgi:hypothetical protein
MIPEAGPTTRLATVTGGTSTTVTVRFDGEANASTRAYVKTYAPAAVGDRVLMEAVGSTWVATARVPQSAAQSPDTGWVTCAVDPNASQLAYGCAALRRNGFVTLVIELTVNLAWGTGYGLCFLPVGFYPARRLWFDLWASGAGPGLVDPNGAVSYQGGGLASGTQVFGSITFPVA